MKRYKEIHYQQRPAGYWYDADVLTLLLRNVKGQERRELIRSCYEQGRLEELAETLLRETLSEEDREELGQIHPRLMGGEYLPDYEENEMEIARIELESTTADVISIRARRGSESERIRYRIVDEYGTEFEPGLECSRKALTLRQLIDLIDSSVHPDIGMGLALCYNEMNAAAGCRENYRSFTRVSSEFYPQLSDHYERVYDDWVAEDQEEQRDAEKETEADDQEETGEGHEG